jgi:hypothetical protein
MHARWLKERMALNVDTSRIKYPTWLDVIIAGALAAALFTCYQLGWIRTPERTRFFAPDPSPVIAWLHQARHLLSSGTPIVIALAIVGFARVLREPKLERRLLFRQPGVAACAAIVAALFTAGANTALWLVRLLEFQEQWLSNGFPDAILLDGASRHLSISVIAAWAYLAFGGMWARRGGNWVNWLGGTLGVLAVFNTLLGYVP